MMRSTTGNRIQGSHSFPQALLERLIADREKRWVVNPTICTGKTQSISLVHAATLAAALLPYLHTGTTLRPTRPDMKGRSNRPGQGTVRVIYHDTINIRSEVYDFNLDTYRRPKLWDYSPYTPSGPHIPRCSPS